VRNRDTFRAVLCAFLILDALSSVRAETLAGALIRAYNANPSLNSARAGLRAKDESVPQALAGARPRVSVDGLLGTQRRRDVQDSIEFDNNDPTSRRFVESIQSGPGTPRSAALSIEQPILDIFKTQSAARAAESSVFAERARLRLVEQRLLLEAVTAYMNVLRETAAFKLQESNVAVLGEQLRQDRERHLAGQITPTDVAQAESRLAAGRSQVAAARAALEASMGVYKQLIGVEPKRLDSAAPVDRLLPKTREDAERLAQNEHPVIIAAMYDIDAADLDMRVRESDFMPKLSVVGNVFTNAQVDGRGSHNLGASVIGKLSVPIYEGGQTSSRVRQAKELAGQRRLDLDVARAEVLALVRANWAACIATKTQVSSAQAQAAAAERALMGVREEAKAGQRTTLDILNAQQELLGARVALLSAQRDRVVASYAVLSATGRLSAEVLGLGVSRYDPTVHFDQVKDSWGGVSVPDSP
jgi:outer membrane protein